MNGYNFTERVRKMLELSRDEATRLRHEYVGTEHLLLGLMQLTLRFTIYPADAPVPAVQVYTRAR